MATHQVSIDAQRRSRATVDELARELAEDTGITLSQAQTWVNRVWSVSWEQARRAVLTLPN